MASFTTFNGTGVLHLLRSRPLVLCGASTHVAYVQWVYTNWYGDHNGSSYCKACVGHLTALEQLHGVTL